MKIRLFIYILLLPFLSALLISCCECDEPIISHFTYQEIGLQHLDNSGSEPFVSDNPVQKSAYGTRFSVYREEIASLNLNEFLLISSAYAFSCGDCNENDFLPQETVTFLKIITLNDFDENHPAGSDISDYFKIYKHGNYKTISEYIEVLNQKLNHESDFETEDDFLLMNVPTINTEHAFKFEIHLSDGRILEQQTSLIDLI